MGGGGSCTRSEVSGGRSSGPEVGHTTARMSEPGSDRIFCPEDTDQLLKAVRTTMKLEEPKEERSMHGVKFEGLEAKHKKVFPIYINTYLQRGEDSG